VNHSASMSEKLRIKGDGTIWLPLDNQMLRIGAGSDFSLYHDGTLNHITANNNAAIKISSNGAQFWDYSGVTRRATIDDDGIKFNADTSADNGLDEYEEGTFTPSVSSGLSAGQIAYNSRSGRYTSIGNVCYFTFHMNISSCSLDSGQLKFGGLPKTSVNNDSNKTGAAFMIISNGNIGSTNTYRVETNSTDLSIITGAGDAYAANSSSLDDGNRQIAFAGFYYTP